jgi:hypothetical protein
MSCEAELSFLVISADVAFNSLRTSSFSFLPALSLARFSLSAARASSVSFSSFSPYSFSAFIFSAFFLRGSTFL